MELGREEKRFLQKRNGVYYFRRAWPDSKPFEKMGREVHLSLKTRDLLLATHRLRLLTNLTDEFIRRLEDGEILSLAETSRSLRRLASSTEPWVTKNDLFEQLPPSMPRPPEGEPAKSVFLNEAVERYLQLKEATVWTRKTLRDIGPMLEEFYEALANPPLEDLSPKKIRSYMDLLVQLPANRNKKIPYRHLSLQQISVMEIPDEDKLSLKSVRNRLEKIRSFLSWVGKTYPDYLRHTRLEEGLTLCTKQTQETPVRAFTAPELQALFEGDSIPADFRANPWRYWLPFLALYSGARLEELCQLKVQDISSERGIPVLRISDDGGKTIKTPSARRLIPLHPDLLDLGFHSYVRTLSGGPERRIFEELSPSPSTGKLGDLPGKWFSRHLRSRIDAEKRKLVFHSFRHSFAEAAKLSQMEERLLQQLLGHRPRDLTNDVYARVPFPVTEARTAVSKMAFGLDLEHVPRW